jgi:cob(I)alamin adenosyltransferase
MIPPGSHDSTPEAAPGAAHESTPERVALRITRVYTRIGDGGRTQLCGGRWVPKDHPRLEAYGAVDELQVAIAAARDAIAGISPPPPDPIPVIAEHLVYIQNRLFTLGGDLSTPVADRWPEMPLIEAADADYLEKLIDALNGRLPPLRDFLLPGGHTAVTALHACRVVCRRAERAIERLAAVEPIGDANADPKGDPIRPFANRLSDAFFVLARAVDAALRDAGLTGPETIWRRDLPPPPMPSA